MEDMSAAAVDDVLYREGFGVLGIGAENRPYLLPMSFGYDGQDCYIQMTTEGRKNDLLAGNRDASLAVVSLDPQAGSSESVIVEGRLESIPAAEEIEAFAALADNAEFGTDLSIWGEPLESVDLDMYRLTTDLVSGRRFAVETSTSG